MSEIVEKQTNKQALKPPSMWTVVMHNDDFTPMEFVEECLQKFFGKSMVDAARLMFQVHLQGKARVGQYSREIAETKLELVMDYARQNEHPLQLSLEKND